MKKNAACFAVLALFLAACGAGVNPPAASAPQAVGATAYIDPASYPTAEARVAAPDQSAGGIYVRIESVSVEGKTLNADVCFTLPDSSDWGIESASLTYGGENVREFGSLQIGLQEPTNGGPGLRCDKLTFVIPPDADLSNAAIIIDSIGATPRGDDYCAIYMPKIQQSLLERGIGIALACSDVNGVQTMQIVSFPPEMTREQAEELVYSPDFYSVKGPWVFPFSVQTAP